MNEEYMVVVDHPLRYCYNRLRVMIITPFLDDNEKQGRLSSIILACICVYRSRAPRAMGHKLQDVIRCVPYYCPFLPLFSFGEVYVEMPLKDWVLRWGKRSDGCGWRMKNIQQMVTPMKLWLSVGLSRTSWSILRVLVTHRSSGN